MTTEKSNCLISQSDCGRVPGNPVCSKCGMDERVVYPSEEDLCAAQAKAVLDFNLLDEYRLRQQKRFSGEIVFWLYWASFPLLAILSRDGNDFLRSRELSEVISFGVLVGSAPAASCLSPFSGFAAFIFAIVMVVFQVFCGVMILGLYRDSVGFSFYELLWWALWLLGFIFMMAAFSASKNS